MNFTKATRLAKATAKTLASIPELKGNLKAPQAAADCIRFKTEIGNQTHESIQKKPVEEFFFFCHFKFEFLLGNMMLGIRFFIVFLLSSFTSFSVFGLRFLIPQSVPVYNAFVLLWWPHSRDFRFFGHNIMRAYSSSVLVGPLFIAQEMCTRKI